MLFNILTLLSLTCAYYAFPKHFTHSRAPGFICKQNEHFVRHNRYCPITCENRFLTSPFEECKPRTGCFCNYGYIRLYSNATGPCIPDNSCPPESIRCGLNEEPTDCIPRCTETCDSLYLPRKCRITNATCTPGYKCVANHLRNELGICIPKELCPIPPDVCEDRCIPTCAIPNPPDCPYKEHCECQTGYIKSKINGECIKIEDCPKDISCNGDAHARIKECPLPCPSTCDSPNAGHCLKTCERVGCECEPGYILSEINGRCVRPEECKGGYPCKGNQTFVSCKSHCNTNYCPTDDNVEEILCDLSLRCLSGCACKFNYRRISNDDSTCIAARECPPVTCTRPNEVWNPCPSPCLKENCEDILIDYPPEHCKTGSRYCNPRCVCKKNHFRDETSTCVTAEECPYYYFDR
ncbi:hypothetical protein K1T71_006768 [Dendrolimus kikuchii]|uniref:Uncharacterized protein n=1 Tax=Dendrolimus kikuchii TaxID=765133 RepID=A0ACC1D257_9NEOP|nr:hypothetical protein K1T71_006768 [Dendrolimus kikuchii]